MIDFKQKLEINKKADAILERIKESDMLNEQWEEIGKIDDLEVAKVIIKRLLGWTVGLNFSREREYMKAEQIIEVIDKLVGGITPIGETNYDNKAKENLNVMIEIVGHYVDEICEVAQSDSYMASIQNCQEIAKDFIKGLRDAYESLDA